MIADPFGNRLTPGPSIHPDQSTVEYLVEVCDPSEDFQFGYDIDDVRVSDFYTPAFFSTLQGSTPQYSFTNSIHQPRQVLEGGYLSWRDPTTDEWWQQIFFGPEAEFRNLGPIDAAAGNFREQIDRQSMREEVYLGRKVSQDETALFATTSRSMKVASSRKAHALNGQIDALIARYKR
jgi:hypothetical protein